VDDVQQLTPKVKLKVENRRSRSSGEHRRATTSANWIKVKYEVKRRTAGEGTEFKVNDQVEGHLESGKTTCNNSWNTPECYDGLLRGENVTAVPLTTTVAGMLQYGAEAVVVVVIVVVVVVVVVVLLVVVVVVSTAPRP